jgi:(R,R)-butanediol dehydrogenase/meso-butanediol dehydrogenase/diacetyl reductase
MTAMRAAVYHGRRDVRIEERPVPVPGPGELLVRVTRCGICGTDAGEYAAGPRMFPTERAHPISGHQGPMVLGHEFTGEVVERGAGVADGWAGRRVVSGAGVSCGTCDWCAAGRTNLCARYWTLGLNADGGLAGYVAVPVASCWVVPDGVSDDAAGLTQPLAVGLHAVRRAAIRPGATVVLIGAGAIGSFVLAGLADARPDRVIAVDVDATRLAAAAALGATALVDAADDAVGAIRELTGGRGADVVVEASGAPGNAQRAGSMAARGGRVLLVGLPHEPQQLDLADLTLREVDLRTTVAHVGDEDVPAALDLLARTDLTARLLDRVIPLDRVVPDGLEAMLNGDVSGKVLIDPHA